MPGTLSQSNRTQLRRKPEGTYPTNFGVVQSGNGNNVNMTGESLDFDPKYIESKTLRADRLTPDAILVDAEPKGGFNFELQLNEYDEEIQGAFQSSWTHYGTNGLGAAFNATTTSSAITAGSAPTGGSALTSLEKGQWFTLVPDAAESDAIKAACKGRAFRVSLTTNPTSTVLTVDASTPIPGALATLTGVKIRSSRMATGVTPRTETLEVAHEDVGVYRVYKGMMVSKMDLKFATGEIVSGSFEFMGAGMSIEDATAMGTPVDSLTTPIMNAVKGIFDVFEGGASVTATTYIKSADVSIDNVLRGQKAIGVLGNAGVGSGRLKASAKLEVYLADKTIYNKLLGDVSSSLTIPVLDSNGQGYVFTFPRGKYTSGKVNAGGLDQDNMLSMEMMALLDAASGKQLVVYRV